MTSSVARLIQDGGYSLIIIAEHTKGRLHARSLRARGSDARSDETLPALTALLDARRSIIIPKRTRSVFGNGAELAAGLRRRRIGDVHIAGIETHDCVLATALDAFDAGFATCVMEKACASKRATDHAAGLRVLRRLHLTDRTIPF